MMRRNGENVGKNTAFCLVLLGLGVALITVRKGLMGAQDVMVPMSDGTELPTKIWKPRSGSYPAVLTRGYRAGGLGRRHAGRFTDAGYIFVDQQCRGNGGSDGGRFFPDDRDGYDCIEWISKQPWCDGKIAMWGGSYWGITQWRAAVAQHPNLKAIVPGFTDASYWKNGYRSHGAIHLKMTTQSNRAIPSRRKYSLEQWKQMLMYLPLIDMDRAFLGREDGLWNDYISHSCYDDYWKALSMREGNQYGKVKIPVYIMAGFRDYYSGAAFESYSALKAVSEVDEIRVRVADIGHSGAPDVVETIRWLDHVLKGVDTGIAEEPPIKLQVRGGKWRLEHQWPLEETRFTKFYFRGPNGSKRGMLSTTAPGDESPTRYVYDPNDPVLTLGANGSHESIPGLIEVGPVDQRRNEKRQDVLVYTSASLTTDMEVIGPVEVKLYAASSATDTDFTAKLIDVYPDGTALNITEGIVRTRFRQSIWEAPSLTTPGRVYEYRIELLPVAVVFAKGHCIRVHLSSSSWPLWDRNQNTGKPIGMDMDMQIAEQTIYHDQAHPSHIILPIIK
ncbi:MAG: CocE/NonD family hydrolase [Planctomycetota bacterium]|jgi:putative CocE/NonD family hydrolase